MEYMQMTPLGVLAASDIQVDVPDGIDRNENGCALWPFGKTAGGYGVCYPSPGDAQYVHRLVCIAAHGPIPGGWHVDHVWERGCRSRACFWPGHLEAVSHGENARRMGLAMRQRGPRPCGHSWDDDRPGRNDCAVCHREAEAVRRAAEPKPAHERVRYIRKLLQDDLTDHEVAGIVGVSWRTVSRVRRGEVYAHVE